MNNDNPPLLLLHGVFGRPGLFDHWSEAFRAAGYRCHVPALPGRDPSDPEVLRRVGVLCVSGGRDRNVAGRLTRRMVRRYGADHLDFPDLPHWLVAPSALDRVAPPVLRWLHEKLT